MDRGRIGALLDEVRANELAAIMQYMGHHYEAEGLESAEIRQAFKDAAIGEMRHAERLAERIVYLGGIPTQKPSPFKRGGDLRQMLQDNLDLENAAIVGLREKIKICAEEGDPTSRLLLEEVLADEERHADDWETLLGRGAAGK